MPTKVEILYNNVPLVGATVLVGEIGGKEMETDEGGKVALPHIEAGYASYTEVLIEAAGIFASAKIKLEYNKTTTIDLGEYEE